MLKVLVADDETLERRYLVGLFQKHPEKFHIAGTAKNGQEILELTECHHPDIIIMDINMPMVNGLEAALKIKQRFPETLILLNTAYAEFEFARKAIDYNLDAYLLKPAKEEEILHTIDKCLEKRPEAPLPPPEFFTPKDAVSYISSYICENFQKPLSLQVLADQVHFSPSYLSKLFHQSTGMTLKAYINMQRLQHAETLLKNTELSVQEIAAACGYSTPSHFNRVFKQQTGTSPLEYRHINH